MSFAGTFAPQPTESTARVMVTPEPSDLRYDLVCDHCGCPIYRGESYVTHDEDDFLTFCSKSCALADLRENY